MGRDHPRSRGNNSGCHSARPLHRGSPPLTREQQSWMQWKHLSERITPAHAGTTLSLCPWTRQDEDHPRSRGNNTAGCCLQYRIVGSPPLTREQLHEIHCVVSQLGITPAHAGTTDAAGFNGTGQWDHPRSRGNNHYPFTQIRFVLGSPPLTREQRTGK